MIEHFWMEVKLYSYYTPVLIKIMKNWLLPKGTGIDWKQIYAYYGILLTYLESTIGMEVQGLTI